MVLKEVQFQAENKRPKTKLTIKRQLPYKSINFTFLAKFKV